MTTDLAISEGKLPIMMKGGVVHWITPETHTKLQEQLTNQSGHTFIRIKELALVINSAEIEGVYTLEQYADWVKVKQGMWQCEYRKWHQKKNECECKQEWREKKNEQLRRIREAEENKQPTDEEREALAVRNRKSDEIYALTNPTSVFRSLYRVGNRSGKKLRRSTINEWEVVHGTQDLSDVLVEEDAPKRRVKVKS